MKKPFYITTTLPYVNGDPHIGFALEIIRADIVARTKKLAGYEVFFNTGTDEHGAKIEKTAAAQNMAPQKYVDEKSEKYRELMSALCILPEANFIRTTDAHHIMAAQEFWRIVNKNGWIYKKDYSIKYCVGCELEKTESELVLGRCPLHPHQEIEIIKEENYFFKFSAFQKPLLDLYNANPALVVPDFRFNEIRAFVERGLEDFSISRLASKMSWGIPVPDDPDQVMYVWFDALVNYVSCIGWPDGSKQIGKEVKKEDRNGIAEKRWGGLLGFEGLSERAKASESETHRHQAMTAYQRTQELDPEQAISKNSFQKFWIDSGGVVQYCGKDNLRQQSAMWQAMLLAAGLPPSKTIVIDGFITGDGGIKMSKSLGNTVDPFGLVREYGTDALRYFVARELHPFEDSPFTPEKFKDAYNAGLANGLGNLVSRIMKMSQDNLVEPISIVANGLPAEYLGMLDSFNLKSAGDFIWSKISALDNIIQQEKPFTKLKDPATKSDGLETIGKLVKGLGEIAFLLEPYLPETSQKIQTLIKENKMPVQPLFMRK
jgi:methionyl-tRNA synthetase